jgi:hypothetical protein
MSNRQPGTGPILKGKVSQVPGFFCEYILLGSCLLGLGLLDYGLPSIGGRLLIDARRSSLLVQFGEKRFFLQQTASPQQFQEGILPVGCGAAGLAWFLA